MDRKYFPKFKSSLVNAMGIFKDIYNTIILNSYKIREKKQLLSPGNSMGEIIVGTVLKKYGFDE